MFQVKRKPHVSFLVQRATHCEVSFPFVIAVLALLGISPELSVAVYESLTGNGDVVKVGAGDGDCSLLSTGLHGEAAVLRELQDAVLGEVQVNPRSHLNR